MSYWGYVADALLNEDRDTATRRRHRRARIKQARERAVLDAAAAALPKDPVSSAEARPSAQPVAQRADQRA
jgi:hypothetical protein